MKLPSGYVPGQGVVKASGKGGMGERLLRNMGWQDGQGLGKAGQGMVEALQVKKKEDTVGVGANKTWKWEEKWWENAFDSAAKTALVPSSHSEDSDVNSDDDTSIDGSQGESENFEGKRPICRLNRDGTRSTGSALELKLLEELTEEVGRVAAGRFAGRGGKMARIRAQELQKASEAAQKLGKPTTLEPSPSLTSLQGSQDSSETNHGCTTHRLKAERVHACGKRKDRENAGSMGRHHISAAIELAETCEGGGISVGKGLGLGKGSGMHSADKKSTTTEWWGANIFVSAGCLNGLSEEDRRKRQKFDEEEQSRIYNQAHLGKAQGKTGLGQHSRANKKGGTQWIGTKVTFDEGDNETGNVQNSMEKQSLSVLKWKKMIKCSFRSEDASKLKLKALCRAIVPLAVEKLNWKPDLKDIEARVVETISSESSKYVLEGKYVKLKLQERKKKG